MSSSVSKRHDTDRLIPDRIRLARMRRGLSKVMLASGLGLTSRTIANYEREGAPATAAPRLGEVLGFPADYFRRPVVTVLTAPQVNFRAGRRTTATQRAAALASGTHAVELSQWVTGRFRLPSVDVPDLTGEGPLMAAQLLRQAWGLGVTPLPNLVQLSESRGIRVFGLPPLAAAVDAFSAWHDEAPYIFLARRRTPEDTRFDLAHELGHLVLHSRRGAEPTEAPDTARQEREADEFASELLFPRKAVFECVPHNPPVDRLLQVKRHFGVSALAAAHSTHKAGRMSDWCYRQTMTELGRRGFRTGEPGGMSSYEHSRVFAAVFSPGNQQKNTVPALAGQLCLPPEDVHALTLESSLFLAAANALRPVRGTDPVATVPAADRAPSRRRGHLRVVSR